MSSNKLYPKIEPRFFSEELLSVIEKKKNAKFVVESSIKQSFGWLNEPVAIFYYSEKVHEVSNSHYFGILIKNRIMYIVNGQSAVEEPFTVMEFSGKIYNSVYRNDFVVFDGNGIDGGREYLRVIGDPLLKQVKIIEDHLEYV